MPALDSAVQNLENLAANQDSAGSDQPNIDLEKLAAQIVEKLRREIEIENERTGRSWDR